MLSHPKNINNIYMDCGHLKCCHQHFKPFQYTTLHEFNCMVVTLFKGRSRRGHDPILELSFLHRFLQTELLGEQRRQPLAVSMANCSESDPDCFHRRKDQTSSCSSDSDCYETVCLIPLFSDVGTCLPSDKIPFPNHQVSCGSFQNLIVTGSPLSDVPVCGNTICLLLLLLQASVPEVQDGSSDILTRKFLGNGPRLCRDSNPSQTELGGNHRW